MITEGTIYWITRLDHILDAAPAGILVFSLLSIILGCLFCAFLFDTSLVECAGKDTVSRYRRVVLVLLLFCVFSVFLCVGTLIFVPTTKEMAMIKVLPMLANSKFVEEELPKDAQRIYRLGIRALEEKLEIKGSNK